MDTASDAPQDFTMTAARPRAFSRRSFITFAAATIAAESAAGILAACGGSTTAPTPTTTGRTAATTAAGGSAAAPTVIRSSGASAVSGSPAASGTATTTGTVGPSQAKIMSGPSKLVLAQTAEPSTLDPQFEQSGIIGTYLNPMVEHLMDFNRDLAITNVLADTSQQPTDGVTYRFKLRPNMKFWDGTPVDAKAVKFTYDRALDPANRKKGLSDPVPTLQGVDHVNVIDPLTVDVVTAKPSTLAWPFFCQEFILNPAFYGAKSFEETAIQPMGSGPWKFVKWTKGDQMEMAANADYWRGKPQIDSLIFRTIPDAGTRLALLERGDADIITDISPDDLPTINGNDKLRSTSVQTTFRVFIGVPCNQAKWKDRQARVALNYAINVDNIVKYVLGGLPGERLRTPVITPGWPNPDIKPYTFDQAKAKAMLTAAQFDFSQPVTLYTTQGGMKRLDVAQAIVADLNKLGMKATVQVLQDAVFTSKLKAREFDDLYLNQLGAPSYGPVEVALPTGDLGLDSTHFPDATADGPKYLDLYQQVRTTFDVAKQHDLVNQMQALLMEESPWILLYLEPYLFGVNKRVDWQPTSYTRLDFWLPG